ncbi:Glutathione-dependent formaldehyde-activating enzyme [Geosmithia morbida]|uniref:Glutathione-dependent formaldehyde-activating enzyme n=1 Tax=Geosmithia morbida TaxID=1094350 RepID=A0A9P4YRD7_9HYPO|nr:Glutathione-dependent formaldehyde-activating enzyme [Geosmithia morbida]KAF4121716.1 Glutathione-dependent formaldehyde-activating enzyme [Geosmithia morbida]
MDARCQCGSVEFKTPLDKPLALYICHCLDCRRQTSSAFGASAIFPVFELPRSELLSCYSYFCRNCGTRLFHTTPARNVVSIKAGCIEGLDWNKAIHIWTKNAMVPIPEGAETHAQEAGYLSYGSSMSDLDQPGPLAGSGHCHSSEFSSSSGSATG